MHRLWPEDEMWSYQFVRALAQAEGGGGSAGEMLSVVARARPEVPGSWRAAWETLADAALRESGRAPEAFARRALARRAAYLRLAAFFLPHGDPDEERLQEAAVAAFRKAYPEHEALAVPYGGGRLHGYVVAPSTPAARPWTLVIVGGLESTAEEVCFAAAHPLAAAGYRSVVVELPGQGRTRRWEGLVADGRSEGPVGAVLDAIEGWVRKAGQRVGIVGYSLGGYFAARAAAFERRLAAAVVWGAVVDYEAVWARRPDDHPLAPRLEDLVGAATMTEARRRLEGFRLGEAAGRIACPTRILHGEADRQVPLTQAHALFAALTCDKDLVVFPAGEPGSIHCQWDAPHLAHAAVAAWFERVDGGRAG